MLQLASSTSPGWVERAASDLEELLVDHAHCEAKAASTAVKLLFAYPEHEALLVPLAELAREELHHFELVLEQLKARGGRFRRLPASPYASALRAGCRRAEPGRLLDTLLCCALIEARSCERMRLLAEGLPDAELADFYRGLLASEARHFRTYLDLAGGLFPAGDIRERLGELAAHEAEVLERATGLPRLHD